MDTPPDETMDSPLIWNNLDGALDTFWHEARKVLNLPEGTPMPESLSFGRTHEEATILAEKVMLGSKRAFSLPLWMYEIDGEQLPVPGDLAMVLTGCGMPLCVIETTEVKTTTFDKVDLDFALDEAKGESLEEWREQQETLFRSSLSQVGREFAPDIPVVLQHIRVCHSNGPVSPIALSSSSALESNDGGI